MDGGFWEGIDFVFSIFSCFLRLSVFCLNEIFIFENMLLVLKIF